MTLDRELVTRKLLLVAADIEALHTIAGRGVQPYVHSWVDQAVAERYLERAIIGARAGPAVISYFALSDGRNGDSGLTVS